MSIILPPCKTCKFWGLAMKLGDGEKMFARCFRYPPSAAPSGGFDFPLTREGDACGEHMERER